MVKHKDKRLKRILKDLQYCRKAIIRSFNETNKLKFDEEDSRDARESVDRDKELIKHIDPLIMAASELLGLEPPKLEKVPRVTIQHANQV
ncbi:unnamed protein product [marine sediment metagenome]|uniref:Uncharacterized protein n=1 Tax=marine sediment metagenome TaxID=412755 RepID=X1DXY3_9ZZZZ